MRILLLVPLHLNKGEKLNKKIINHETSLPTYQAHNFWHKALKYLGHEVKLIIYSGRYPPLDYYSRLADFSTKKFKFLSIPYTLACRVFLPSVHKKQFEILSLCKNFQPELIILSGNTDSVFSETLFEIKKLYRSKVVLFNGLSPVVFATKTERILAPFLDFVFTNDKYHAIDWAMLGALKAQSLPVSAIDPSFHRTYKLNDFEKRRFGSDVSFVGSLYPPQLYRDRIESLEKLTKFDLKIWTDDKEVVLANKNLKKFYAGSARGIKMLKVFSSAKINLNFHGHTMLSGGNLRTFEIPACGGFEIVDRINPKWFTIGKEVITYSSISDLIDKIRYFLENDNLRRKIALNGHARAYSSHTYRHRFDKMFRLLDL